MDSTSSPARDTGTLIVPAWLARVCKPERMLWLGPLLGFVLTIPAFFMGYVLDDHFLRQSAIGSSLYRERPSWDLFSFVSSQADVSYYRERGILLAWWTPDSFRNHFFRPIASLVHAAHFRFLDGAPWVMHVVVAGLYAVTIYLCARLLLRLASSRVAAGIGTLLFAVNDAHAFSSGMVWGTNTMLCALLGLGALLLHDRWRHAKSMGGLLLFCLMFALSLLCSEGGLALMGYLLAHALLREEGSLRRRLLTLAPGALITAAYLIFYAVGQYGVKSSGVYQSPVDEPLGSLAAVAQKTAMLVGSQVVSFPPLTVALAAANAPAVMAGLALLLVAVFLSRGFLRSNRSLRFFGAAMVLSIIPFAFGPLQDRLLLWSGLGAAGLLGELFATPAATLTRLQRGVARGLLFTNAVVAAVFYVPSLYAYGLLEKPSQLLADAITEKDTVLFSAPLDIFSWYPPAIAAEKGRQWPQHFYFFYTGPETMVVGRTGERTFVANVEKGWFRSPETERFTRSSQLPFALEDRVELELMTVTIEKVTEDGRPRLVHFEFKKDLSEFAWMRWAAKGPVSCELPPIGSTMRLQTRLF
ncbi:MAG: hypothetical protein JW751_20820 [Polyangiaceae bacterium]|nr:hypothetical protein [Polyangiaceae bacterium]